MSLKKPAKRARSGAMGIKIQRMAMRITSMAQPYQKGGLLKKGDQHGVFHPPAYFHQIDDPLGVMKRIYKQVDRCIDERDQQRKCAITRQRAEIKIPFAGSQIKEFF